MPQSRRTIKLDILRLEAAIGKVMGTIEANQKAIEKYSGELEAAKARLNEYEGSERELKVSEHAVIRYMERHMGIDIETLRLQITTEELSDKVEQAGGAGKFAFEGGTLVVEDCIVFTFLKGPRSKS